MTAPPFQVFHLAADHDRQTVATALKRLLPDLSWSKVRQLIAARRVEVNGNLCLDDARGVKGGDVLKLWQQPRATPVREADVRLAYVDEHLVVVQKPAGITTLRHREETDLPERRKQLQPTLDEIVPRLLASHLGIALPDHTSPQRQRGKSARHSSRGRKAKPDKRLQVRPVHRLDRDTSGLMVFARTPAAEQRLIRMFAKHEVQRAYVAVVPGRAEAQTIDTWLVRDRGDGLRGSASSPPLPLGEGRREGPQRAITHIRPLEHLPDYTILECRLETGRTHQIRIHLSEIGHSLCGEKVYTHPLAGKPTADSSGAPRQVLHAAELAFLHPITGQPLRFRMPLPRELREWLVALRGKSHGPPNDVQ